MNDIVDRYDTVCVGGVWSCTCKYYTVKHADCRHIFLKKYSNLQIIYRGVLEKIMEHRDTRDSMCDTMVDVVERGCRVDLVHSLCELVLRIALEQGSVCSDDLHAVTNERYHDDRIVGVVFAVLLRQGVLRQVGFRHTVRKCAHGRGIGVYCLKERQGDKCEVEVVGGREKVNDLLWVPVFDNPFKKQSKLME